MAWAIALGMSQPVYSNYESGGQRRHGELLIRFSHILNVSADEILGIRESSLTLASLDSSSMRRLEMVEKLSMPQQQALARA
jgi:transcriptional regulator with XRE-family HTH domain